MILEDEVTNHTEPSQTSTFETKILENGRSTEESEISRLRWDFRNKIRIRELEKMKAEKRKVIQTNMIIEEILQRSFPKESDEVKHWAHNLVQLFDSSKKYETEAAKLREIFVLAEKFPNLGTLRLFYLALINSSSQNVRNLFDLDVWRFLHNILQFPNLNSCSKKIINEETSCSPSSKNLNTLFVEIEMIKAAIETFVCLFKKDLGFRDYSIGIHQSFSNYLRPAYRKYGESIKTEVIYFIKEVFYVSPKSYSKEYLSIVKFTLGMFIDYKEKFSCFFNKKEWNEVETKETVEEAIKRAGTLMAIMYKLFNFVNTKWLYDLIQGGELLKEFNYLNIIHTYLEFGECVLNKLLNNNENLTNHSEFFENTIDFMHNCFTFYFVYVEKTIQDGPENVYDIPDILKKAVLMLELLKKCEENKVFNEIKRELMLDIEKTKEACLFAIDSSLTSEFDNYNSFFKDFIFFEDKNGNKVNLLIFLEYFLNTSHHSNIISELASVIFSLLRMKVPEEEINKFLILREMMEKICDLLADELILENTKEKICSQFLGYLEQGCETLGWHLRIEDIFVKNLNKINEFMDGEFCSKKSYQAIDKVIKLMRFNQQEY